MHGEKPLLNYTAIDLLFKFIISEQKFLLNTFLEGSQEHSGEWCVKTFYVLELNLKTATVYKLLPQSCTVVVRYQT